MKWVPFAILAVIALSLQTTVVRYVAIQGAYLDLMFILAVHYALWGPWPDAAIAAWVLGLLFGLQSIEPAALYAFAYGGAAWGIIRIRQIVFRDHPITHCLVTFFFALLVELMIVGYERWMTGPGSGSGLWLSAIFTSLFTAVLAPYIHGVLNRLSGWTGLRTAYRDFPHR